MASKARRPVVESKPAQTKPDAEAERLGASGRDSMPHRAAGETSRETAFFGTLPLADREFLVKCRVDIERKVSIESHTFFDIGDILDAAKAKLLRGAYLPWVDRILRITARTAQNYRGAAAAFVGEEARETISFLGPAVIYKLSGADPRLVELRMRLLAEISVGARPTGREVEDMIAAALGKESPQAQRSATAKHPVADTDIEDKVSEPAIEIYNSATNEAIDLIIRKSISEIDELLALLKIAQPELIGKLLISKCEAYCDCVDTRYTPKFHSEIVSSPMASKYIAASTP